AEDGIREFHVTGVQTWLFRSRIAASRCSLTGWSTLSTFRTEDMLAAAAAKVDPSLEKIATSTSASGNPLAQATHLAVLGLMDAPSCSAIISIFDIRQVLFLSEPLPVRLRRLRQLLSNAAAAPPTKFPGVPVPAASPTPRGSPGRAVFSWLS